jgi:hypothetical protein
MNDEQAGKLIEAMVRVVAQNDALLQQNQQFLEFIRERDASVAAINALNLEQNRLHAADLSEERKLNAEACEALGISKREIVLAQTVTLIGGYLGNGLRARVEEAAIKLLGAPTVDDEQPSRA